MTYVQGGQKEPASTVVKDDRKLPDDKALIGLIGRFFSESRSYHDELKKVQDKGEKYYQGEQTDRSMIKKNFSNAVENKIFENIEAIVPMVTSRPAEFVALPGDENEVAEQDADMIQKALSAHLRNLKWIQLLEIAVRRALIVRYGVFKIFWNKDKGLNGDVDISLPNPKDIFIPKFGMKIYDVPFIIENLSMTYEQMIVWFGQEKADLALKQFTSNEEDAKFEMKKVRIINEVWTNEWHAYKIGTVILKSELNPYYNFNETDQNFLEEPCKPYVFLSPYRMGNTIIGDTSSMEQSIPIQDIINSTLRIIFNHTKKMGNGTWMVDSTVMSEEEARNKLSNAAGLVVWGKNVADSAKMRRDAPIPLPRGFDNVLAQAERTMDNLWGTHSVTRGEQLPTRETLGAKQQQQQSDISRQGLLVREIEQ